MSNLKQKLRILEKHEHAEKKNRERADAFEIAKTVLKDESSDENSSSDEEEIRDSGIGIGIVNEHDDRNVFEDFVVEDQTSFVEDLDMIIDDEKADSKSVEPAVLNFQTKKELFLVPPPKDIDMDDLLKSDRLSSTDSSYSQMFAKRGIKHIKHREINTVTTWSHHGMSSSERKPRKEYPKSWPYPCLTCRKQFKSVPVFIPDHYDELMDDWVLNMEYAFCCAMHAKSHLVEGSDSCKTRKIQELTRFLREYFIPGLDYIPYISPSTTKEFGGPIDVQKLSLDELVVLRAVHRQPPVRFIPVFTETIIQPNTNKNINHDIKTIELNDTHQNIFEKEAERVKRERKERKSKVNIVI